MCQAENASLHPSPGQLMSLLAWADTNTEKASGRGKALGLHSSPVAQRSNLERLAGHGSCRKEDSTLVLSK